MLADGLPWYQRGLQRFKLPVLRPWPEQHLRGMLPTCMSKREDVRRYVARASQAQSKADMFTVSEAVREDLLGGDPLAHFDVDVLLVCGEGEMPIMMLAWAERHERVRLEVVDDAGHLANQEEPAAFNELLLPFLQENLPLEG